MTPKQNPTEVYTRR